MPWVRLDEQFSRHPKVVAAGPLGMALQVAGLCYCNEYLTDGFVPRHVVPGLLNYEGIAMHCWSNEIYGGGEDAAWDVVVADVVEAGLWSEVEGGYRIHDYHDYQPSKADVLADRKQKSEAGRLGGVNSAKARRAKTSQKEASATAGAKANAEAVAQAESKPVPVPVTEASNDASAERVQDELWETLVEELGDVETKSERGKRNTALKELRDVGATPEEIRRRCTAYRQKWPHLTLTATALTAHWSSLVHQTKPRNNATAAVDLNLPELTEEEIAENKARLKAMTA